MADRRILEREKLFREIRDADTTGLKSAINKPLSPSRIAEEVPVQIGNFFVELLNLLSDIGDPRGFQGGNNFQFPNFESSSTSKTRELKNTRSKALEVEELSRSIRGNPPSVNDPLSIEGVTDHVNNPGTRDGQMNPILMSRIMQALSQITGRR